MVAIDDLLKEQVHALKSEREKAQAALDRVQATMSLDVAINDDKVHAFGHLIRQQMDLGDIPARKSLIRSVVSAITVSDNRICIIGDKDRLTAAVLGAKTTNGFVRGSVREWRARKDSNL